MNDQDLTRDAAMEVTRTLSTAGYQVYWAGGYVRDQKLGNSSHDADIDIATDAQPDQIRQLFGERRTIAVGAAFGVIMVMAGEGKPIEVATFRSDAQYSDGRHPDRVTFTDAREDAQRRDFTINGMFYDPLSDEYIDHVHGQADIDARLVRAIGEPEKRFAEDKLRLLRAVRFAASLQFRIEEATWAAIEQHADEITVVSAERILGELEKIFGPPERLEGLRLLRDSGLLAAILPELDSRDPAAWNELEQTLERLPSSPFPVVLAASWTALAGDTDLAAACQRLKLSNHDRQLALWLHEHLPRIVEIHQVPWPHAQRLLIEPRIELLVGLATARAATGGETPAWLTFCQEKLSLDREQLDPLPLIDGNDLLEAGIPAGPSFRTILEQVRDAQLDGQLADHQQALALARQLASHG
ncbi:MAG: CCA tRNA nucleotidyltransferase [Planctomycetota bacterium]|nr:CCA tRNA nucleotidyltransferase [Planctomycetota bacterium]